MEIQLPQEQRAIVECLVAAGRFSSVEDAISEGIRLLACNEKLRREVQVGLEQANRGELIDHDTVFGQLKTLAKEAKASNGWPPASNSDEGVPRLSSVKKSDRDVAFLPVGKSVVSG